MPNNEGAAIMFITFYVISLIASIVVVHRNWREFFEGDITIGNIVFMVAITLMPLLNTVIAFCLLFEISNFLVYKKGK